MSSIIEYVTNLPRKHIYILIIFLVGVPVIMPFKLVIPVSENTENYYNILEAVKPGDVVLFSSQISVKENEIYPMVSATLYQLKQNGAKVITYAPIAESALGFEWVLDENNYDELTYGTDYVHLGFLPGEDATLMAFAEDIVGTREVDHYGNPTASMPIFENVNTMEDIDLVITISGGAPGFDLWARIAIIPYDRLAIIGSGGSTVSGVYDYLDLGVFAGGVIAQKGAVEYETILGRPGRAIGTFAPPYLLVLALCILMVFNNVVDAYKNLSKGGQN